MAASIKHGECGREWTGSASMHCSGCHETFSGLTLFDDHRRGYGERGSCKSPKAMRKDDQSLRLIEGVWHYPEKPVDLLAKLAASFAA